MRFQQLGTLGRRVLEELRPFAIGSSNSGEGTITKFRLQEESVAILSQRAEGLYAWRGPRFPENLSLLRRDGTPWLISISAYRISYMELTPFEKLLLGRVSTSLAALLDAYGGVDAATVTLEKRLESELIRISGAIAAETRLQLEDREGGVIMALERWLASGDPTRITLALDAIEALRIGELVDEVADLREAVLSNRIRVPAGYAHNPLLGDRWMARFVRRVDAVLAGLADEFSSTQGG
ncbi:MAG TPA: hypothetical protein VE219_05090 [Candidatus Sulfotelmatobacter sp.]|nr:hypothetical protein [Candidatus Sulfotelmatobacter sp.]